MFSPGLGDFGVTPLGCVDDAPLCVHHELPIAHLAVQPVFVRAFDAGFTDVRRAGVVAALDAFEIGGADAADVADGVRAQLAERIVARQRDLNVHAGEQVSAHGKGGGLLFREVAQLHAFEPAVRANQIAERVVLAAIDEPELLERVQCAVEIADLLADGDELPVRPIFGYHDPVAVVDDAARRRQRVDAKAIALRQLAEPFVVQNLKLHEARDQQAGQQQDNDGGRNDARQEQPLLLPVILQL